MFETYSILIKKFDKLVVKSKKLEKYELKKHGKLICTFQNHFTELDELLKFGLFTSDKEEIEFYKKTLPRYLYHYYSLILTFKLYHSKPIYTEELIPFYKGIVKQLIHFKEEHISLYYYWVSETNNRDAQYFATNNQTTFECLSTNHHSYIFAYFKVIEEMVATIQQIIFSIDTIDQPNDIKLQWTESITSLVALIYGLKECSYVNQGNITIKELCIGFERLFNIPLQQQVHSLIYSYQKRKIRDKNIFTEMNKKIEQRGD
jgi:hypothetical protein